MKTPHDSKPSAATRRIIAAALDADCGITPAHRRRIMEALTTATPALESGGRFYTPTEAAALCGVTLAGLLGWVRTGKMEAHRIGRRNYLIPASAVDAMLASRQPPPVSAADLPDRLAHLAAVVKPASKSRRR